MSLCKQYNFRSIRSTYLSSFQRYYSFYAPNITFPHHTSNPIAIWTKLIMLGAAESKDPGPVAAPGPGPASPCSARAPRSLAQAPSLGHCVCISCFYGISPLESRSRLMGFVHCPWTMPGISVSQTLWAHPTSKPWCR